MPSTVVPLALGSFIYDFCDVDRIAEALEFHPIVQQLFSQLILALPFLFGSVLGSVVSDRGATLSSDAVPAPHIRPVSFIGNVAVVQATDLGGDTRLFYQNADNSIQKSRINGAFNIGTFIGTSVLVPAQEVIAGTPIAAALIGPGLHVFFVSPSNILSEYIWSNASGAWRGGPSCSDCITVNQFVVLPGSKVLYAMGNSAAGSGGALLRVGFVSAGVASTLTEIDFVAGRGWQVAAIP
ncbi:hypothetical protein C8J57DRAFT_1718157 [Mycena rebaudengoi]|nr:hypothetical protein C8J57DRAFT_1718157 [Mycena rebaudengoi]